MKAAKKILLSGLVLSIFLPPVSTTAQKPPDDPWRDWRPFLGTWKATGSGEPGQGVGDFTFQTELQNTILTRHSYAEYPASGDKPAYRHDDLMVIYVDPATNRPKAYFWDNEGHFIRYDVELSGGKLLFVSDAAQPGPHFRLTYAKTRDDALNLTFEIAPPNERENFKKYIEASARRTASAR